MSEESNGSSTDSTTRPDMSTFLARTYRPTTLVKQKLPSDNDSVIIGPEHPRSKVKFAEHVDSSSSNQEGTQDTLIMHDSSFDNTSLARTYRPTIAVKSNKVFGDDEIQSNEASKVRFESPDDDSLGTTYQPTIAVKSNKQSDDESPSDEAIKVRFDSPDDDSLGRTYRPTIAVKSNKQSDDDESQSNEASKVRFESPNNDSLGRTYRPTIAVKSNKASDDDEPSSNETTKVHFESPDKDSRSRTNRPTIGNNCEMESNGATEVRFANGIYHIFVFINNSKRNFQTFIIIRTTEPASGQANTDCHDATPR